MNCMKIVWIDALTPKQALISLKIMEAAGKAGYKSIITTRDYDYTVGIFELKGVKPLIVGRHGGGEAREKLIASLERSMKLAEIILGLEEKPSYHISLSSPEAVRIAFGLSIPIILLNDTPHSKYVNRLTIPLADKLVIPKAIPKYEYKGLIDEERIIQYNGVDEVAWIKDLNVDSKILEKIGLKIDDKVVIAREAEYKASYYNWLERPVQRIIKRIKMEFKDEVKIVYFPRYPDEKLEVKDEDLIIPEKAVDTMSLMKYSILTISGGGTMARESALLGTPSISLFPTTIHVNKWLEEMGLPIKNIRDVDEAYKYARMIIRDPDSYKMDTRKFIEEMEDPTKIIANILRGDNDG